MRFGLICGLLLMASPAAAASSSATALCKMLDDVGLSSAPCAIVESASSVNATMDVNGEEAGEMCTKIVEMMQQQHLHFASGWTLQVKSPESNGESLAHCNLPG